MEAKNKKCFVIMPIGDTEGYEEGHFSKVYENLLKPAIKKAGYQPERADEVQSTNLIAVDIIERIFQTPIAICDVSSCNPNVFYELGIRHTCSLPVVLIKDEKTNNPFDIKDIRYIEYSEQLEYDNVIQKHEEISTAIIKTIDDYQNGVCRNSLISLIKSKTNDNGKVHLYSNIAFLEEEAKRISESIDSACYDSLGNPMIASLITKFGSLCLNYPNGKTFHEYLMEKYRHKFPYDFYRILSLYSH
ncbi:hypothetical protein J8K92_06425 [Bacteroides fragilis]|uniref:hypothetical protein n=1 Tax=Bacteroides fragilis TaxID=817 RepID=UPI002030EB1C|nr:hypothetical protein [Bacteroides fragilis]MCM0298276.1 hypothetical protein [Bacteroides fragilis]